MLHKANSFSTKEYDSYEMQECTHYTLKETLLKEGPNKNNSKTNKVQNTQTSAPTSNYLSWISNQSLSNIMLLVSGPLLVFGYCYANYNQINPIQTVFCKFLVQTIVHKTTTFFTNNQTTSVSRQQLKVMIFRAVFAALNTFVLVIAQEYIPLTAVLTINGSGIVFLYMIVQIINKRTIYSQKVKGIVCCLFGLCFTLAAHTVYPLLFKTNYLNHSYIHYHNMTFLSRLLACTLLSFAVVISTVSLLYGAASNTVSVFKTIQIHSIVGLFMFSILYQSVDFNRSIGNFLKSTFVTGLLFCISNYLYTWGLQLSSKKGLSSFINQLTIIISYLVSICCLNELPNTLQYIGSLLILSSIYYILLKQ